MSFDELKEFIAFYHEPELGSQEGMVFQIWEDGEITLQKSGSLLWQRNLHLVSPGLMNLPKEIMPVVEEKHGYAFIKSETVGKIIRKEMNKYIQQFL